MSKQRILFMTQTINDFLSTSRLEATSFLARTKPQDTIQDILRELQATIVNELLLRETKIGHAINKLRRCEFSNTETKQLAKQILETWKRMVNEGRKAAVVNASCVLMSNPNVKSPAKKRNENIRSKSSGIKRYRTSNRGDFGVRRTKPAPVPTLQELCVQQLREDVSSIGQWRGMRLPDEMLHKIFRDCPGNQLWKICSLNPQWIASLEPIWKKICEKEVMDKKLKKQTTWFALFELWKKKETEKKRRCKLMKEKYDNKKRKETRHITSEAGVRRFKQNGRKRRRKIDPRNIPHQSRLRQAKPIVRAGKVLSMEEWRHNVKHKTRKKGVRVLGRL